MAEINLVGLRFMPLELIENAHGKNNGKFLELDASGKLVDADFQSLEPAFARLVRQHGKLRVLLKMVDFHGWQGIALWDEIKFDFEHLRQIERLAVVGDRQWEKLMSEISRPFTTAEVRFFDKTSEASARAWLEGGEVFGRSCAREE